MQVFDWYRYGKSVALLMAIIFLSTFNMAVLAWTQSSACRLSLSSPHNFYAGVMQTSK